MKFFNERNLTIFLGIGIVAGVLPSFLAPGRVVLPVKKNGQKVLAK